MLIDRPPMPKGTPEQQVKILYDWCVRLTEQLNAALRQLEAKNKKKE